MSKRAEAAALTAYPHKIEEHPKVMGGSITFDANSQPRAFYEQGYEQAEKDLALTIEDIELLHTFLYVVKNNKQGMFTFTRLSDEQYEEVLRRFQNYKAKKEE